MKVGIGAGSICTTRVVAGIGVPMITAIMDCARAAAPHDVPIIADGGIRYSGDITKAIAVGASCSDDRQPVRRHRREPGRDDPVPGPELQGISRHGLASARCAAAAATAISRTSSISRRRGSDKLVPEGIEGRVPHKGSVAAMIHQLVGGLRAGMGYCGAPDIPTLQRKARLVRITPAGARESHVHDVTITKEAPNYRSE